MRHEELRIVQKTFEPLFLERVGSQLAQQNCHLPVLHQFIGETRIATSNFLGDDRKGLDFRRRIKLDTAKLLGHAESADADPLGPLKDFWGQPSVRIHAPFALPISTNEWDDDVINKFAATLPHHSLLFG
jgi:hypothetical protein